MFICNTETTKPFYFLNKLPTEQEKIENKVSYVFLKYFVKT